MNNYLVIIVIVAMITAITSIVEPSVTITGSLLQSIGFANPENFASSGFAGYLTSTTAGIFILLAVGLSFLSNYQSIQVAIMRTFVSAITAFLITDITNVYVYVNSIMTGGFVVFKIVFSLLWLVLVISLIYYAFRAIWGGD